MSHLHQNNPFRTRGNFTSSIFFFCTILGFIGLGEAGCVRSPSPSTPTKEVKKRSIPKQSTPIAQQTPKKKALESSKPEAATLASVGALILKKSSNGCSKRIRVVKKKKAKLVFNYRTLLPVLQGAGWTAILNDISKGHCEKAEKAGHKKGMNGAQKRSFFLQLGRCYTASKKDAKARLFYASLQAHEPLLQDYLYYWRGLTWEEDDQKKAITCYLKVPRGSRFYLSAQVKAVQMLLDLGKPQKALQKIKGQRLSLKQPAVMWLKAQALLAQKSPKKKAKAKAILRKIWVEKPESDEATKVYELMRGKKVRFGLSVSEKIRRAKGLNRVFAYRKAATLLAGVSPPPQATKSLKCRLYYTRGFSWFRRRKYRPARANLGKALKLCQGDSYRGVRSYYYLAEAYRRGGKGGSAGLYRKLASKYPNHYFADDAIFKIADMADRYRQKPKARKLYAELIRRFPKGDMVKTAMWRLAYQAYKQKRYTEALKRFKRITQRFHATLYSPAARYFSARILEKTKKKKKAAQEYLKLIYKNPLSFESFLALDRMTILFHKKWQIRRLPKGKYHSKIQAANLYLKSKALLAKGKLLLPWGPIPAKPPSLKVIAKMYNGERASFLKLKGYEKGVALLRGGLNEDAAEEWLRLKNCRVFSYRGPRRRVKHCGLRGDSGAELLALHFRFAKVYHYADKIYRRHGRIAGRAPFEPKRLRSWYLAYPRPFGASVASATKRDKVPSSFVYGLMREESTFNPRIESWANAYGLMQMILPTARREARAVMRGRRIGPEDLFKPAINIRLGVHHLRHLLSKFSWKYPLTAAGYNAGAGWVRRWLKRNGPLPLDEWLEAVHIKQTRKYIKRVMQSYGVYLFLYGNSGRKPGSLLSLKPWWHPQTIRK